MSRADFLVGEGNREALTAIEAWPAWQAPVVVLTGPAGSGKTHLVEIWRERSGANSIPAATLTEASGESLMLADAVAVEDIDRAPGREPELFHLLNRARELGASVLLTARDGGWAREAALPDLRSRLRAAQPVSLAAPTDDLLQQLLVKLFADRQLYVSPAFVAYLRRRMERSFEAANNLVRRLDEAALATGRPIGRQLAAPFLTGGGDLADWAEPLAGEGN
jgi:chromosomal replication initiation ATPase DnaA